VYNTEA